MSKQSSKAPQKTSKLASKCVRANRFELLDASNRVVGVIDTRPDNNPQLLLFNGDSISMVAAIQSDGSPLLNILRPDGTKAIGIEYRPTLGGAIVIHDSQSMPLFSIQIHG